MTTDFTIEAIAVLNERSPRGILCDCDELEGWLGIKNQCRGGMGGDRSKWLSLWDSSPIIVNRKGEPDPIELDNPFVSVVGCIPPDVFRASNSERDREDGFLHRLLLVMPDSKASDWSDSSVASDTTKAYEQLIDELFKLQSVGNKYGGASPVVVRLTEEAHRVFIDWHNRHTADIQKGQFPENLRGSWRKLEGYAARFALIIHMCRVAAGEVDSEDIDRQSVEGAVELVNYFKSHLRRVYSTLRADHSDKGITAFLAFVRRSGGKVTVREVQRSKVAGLKTSQDVREMFQGAAQRKYGKTVTGTHNSAAFELNGYVSKKNR